jgi:hydroxymethylpyrimidine/phosphomethylpyrimidine kinase
MKQEKVTVKEIKNLVPNAEVYTLNVAQVYLILVNKPKVKLIGSQDSVGNAQKLQEILVRSGVTAIMVALDDADELKIIELKRNMI